MVSIPFTSIMIIVSSSIHEKCKRAGKDQNGRAMLQTRKAALGLGEQGKKCLFS